MHVANKWTGFTDFREVFRLGDVRCGGDINSSNMAALERFGNKHWHVTENLCSYSVVMHETKFRMIATVVQISPKRNLDLP